MKYIFVCTVFAVSLIFSGCSSNNMSAGQTQALYEIFPDKKYNQGISEFTQVDDGSHIFRIQNSRIPVQKYVRKYAAYCIRSGKSVPVKVDQVASASASSTSTVLNSVRLSCQ